MLLNVKKGQHNLKIIRRFEEDIWGVLATKNKPTQVLNFVYEAYQNNFKYKKLLKSTKKSFFLVRKKGKFLYKVFTGEKEFKRKKRTLKINNYLNLLKLRRFYGNIGKRKFWRSFHNLGLTPNIASKGFGYFLESRLDVILYRSNLFSSIFSSRQYIVHKKVFVNGVLVNKPGFRVKIDDIVSVSNPEFFYNDLKSRLLNNQVLGNFPSYLNVNYKLGLVKLIRIPSNKDVPFPFFMNIDTMVHNFTN